MNKKQISFFLVVLALVIAGIIALNYIEGKPKKAKKNPFEYNVDDFRKVDPALIHYKEIRQLKVNVGTHAALAAFDDKIYLAAAGKLRVLSTDGKQYSAFDIPEDARAVAVSKNEIAVSYKTKVLVYDHPGNLSYSTIEVSDSSVFSSLAIWNDLIVVADAGKRRLYGFKNGQRSMEIEGVSGAKNLHGFIVPSASFEVAVNAENELWSTNPGMHALQQYNERGDLLNSWDKASMTIEGFTGCCNPAQFCFLPDGRFVTSEKSMPRIKIYDVNGNLESVVAAPEKFEGNQRAAEVAVVENLIIALDFDREMIRVFEMNNNN